MVSRRNVLAAVLVIALTPLASAQQRMVLKASDVHALGYPTVEAVVRMGKRLEAQTNGRLSIQMYPAMQLGSEKEMIEQAQLGALQIARVSAGSLGPVLDEVNVFNLPFVFRDEAHMRKVIDGPIGQELLDRAANDPKSALVPLGWMDAGTRNLYAKKAIKRPPDLKGQKIRMMGNPIFLETMNAMGGTGVSMGFSELYSAMQTGVVDGAENNPPTYLTQNHYQITRYYNLTGHLIIPEILVFSKRSWEKLSNEDRALIRKLAREAQMEQRQLWDARVTDSTAKLKAAGVQFVEVDRQTFYDATKPVRDKYGAKYAALIKRIDDTK